MSLSSDHSAPRAAQRLLHDAPDKATKCRCAQPRCRKKGSFPAPSTEEGRHARSWLCLEHARVANDAWNIFAGMSDEEVERAVRAAAVGERPTWPVNAHFRGREENAGKINNAGHNAWRNSWHNSWHDSLNPFCDLATKRRGARLAEKRDDGQNLSQNPSQNLSQNPSQDSSLSASALRHPRTQAQREACRVMSLTPPLCARRLKARYRTLAKAHHPDQHTAKVLDASTDAANEARLRQEERQEGFKRINAAYALLQELWQQVPRRAPAMRRKA